MKVINKSRKIISIKGEAFLPGTEMVLPQGLENNPCIVDYIAKGILADADAVISSAAVDADEKARIEQEAVEKYKAEQAEKESEIKAVKSMKKDDLINKAIGMGLEVNDNNTVDELKEKIIAALMQ
jgi:hypothetical protein